MLSRHRLRIAPNVTLRLMPRRPSQSPPSDRCDTGATRASRPDIRTPRRVSPLKIKISLRPAQPYASSESDGSTSEELELMYPSSDELSEQETNRPRSRLVDRSQKIVSTPLGSPFRAGFAAVPPASGPFQLVRWIEDGTFGRAYAARDQSSGRVLCLKMFSKRDIVGKALKEGILRELAVYKRIATSTTGMRGKTFVMELERAMQDSDFISFAMELMAHDLFWLMCHDPCMCRKNARRWSAQIALGIDSLHQMGIIHRDLKAENVLIDVRGNIRIVDFGLAHLGAGPLHWWGEYTDEVMGTLQCMAPEMLQNKDVHTRFKRYYGISVDWWALGCLIYELESEDHLALFSGEESTIGYVNWVQNIRPRNPRHRFPAFIGLSDEAESVISGLLRIRYSFRYKLSDLLQHPYFAIGENATEFDDAEARALARPVDPSLELDFLPDDGDGTLRLFSPDAVVSSWGPHHPDFSEFTWINPRSGVKK